MVNVSIIVPVYNVEEYLGKCLDSLLNQTLSEIEIICINDGSTDRSLDILNYYAGKDNRIIVINKENEGQGVARNLGISLSKGKYIGFVDPDDWVKTNMFEKLYNQAEKLNSEIVVCDYIKYRECDKTSTICNSFLLSKSESKYQKLDVPAGENIDKNLVYKSLLISPCYSWNKIYKTEFLRGNKIIYDKARCFEDCIFIIDAMHLAQNVSYVNSALYVYRIRKSSTLRCTNDISTELLNAFKNINAKLKEHDLADKLEQNLKFFQVMNSFWTLEKLSKSQQRDFIKQFENKIPRDCYAKIKRLLFSMYVSEIFSITNKPRQKVVTIAGLKIKFKHLKGQYKLEQDYINKIKRNQKKYEKDTYLLFDCLIDETVEAIDAYSLFLYMKSLGKKVYYVLLKDNKLYKKLESENNLDGIIGLDYSSKDFPGKLLETLYETLLSVKCIITSFETSSAVEKFFKKNKSWQYIFIQHGQVFLKESVLVNNYLTPKKFDKILISSEEECKLFKKYNWSDDKLIKAGLPRWDLLRDVKPAKEKSIFVMFTWRRFNLSNFEDSLYKKNLLNLLNNKELNDYLKERNIKMYFAPHHSMQGNLNFGLENILCVDSCEVSKYIRQCNALVTDLSSIVFDFMFQDKPVLCYVLDKEDCNLSDLDRFDVDSFDYKKNIMPNVLFDEKSVVEKLKYYIDNDFVLEPEVKKQYNKFFYIKDDIRAKLVVEIDKCL